MMSSVALGFLLALATQAYANEDLPADHAAGTLEKSAEPAAISADLNDTVLGMIKSPSSRPGAALPVRSGMVPPMMTRQPALKFQRRPQVSATPPLSSASEATPSTPVGGPSGASDAAWNLKGFGPNGPIGKGAASSATGSAGSATSSQDDAGDVMMIVFPTGVWPPKPDPVAMPPMPEGFDPMAFARPFVDASAFGAMPSEMPWSPEPVPPMPQFDGGLDPEWPELEKELQKMQQQLSADRKLESSGGIDPEWPELEKELQKMQQQLSASNAHEAKDKRSDESSHGLDPEYSQLEKELQKMQEQLAASAPTHEHLAPALHAAVRKAAQQGMDTSRQSAAATPAQALSEETFPEDSFSYLAFMALCVSGGVAMFVLRFVPRGPKLPRGEPLLNLNTAARL
jgi:hypothetical protein